MTKLKKNYHSLNEMIAAWGLPEADIRYVAENGILRLAVHMYGIFAEHVYEEGFGPQFDGGRLVDGPVDLGRGQICALFRDGSLTLRRISIGEDRCLELAEHQVFEVRPADLVIREGERLRFEREELPTLLVEDSETACFSDFSVDGNRFRFPEMPAAVLQVFYAKHCADPDSWHSGKQICKQAKSKVNKLSIVFGQRFPEWRELIEQGRRGYYRMKPEIASRIAR